MKGLELYYLDGEKLVVGISDQTSRTFEKLTKSNEYNATEKGSDDNIDNEM